MTSLDSFKCRKTLKVGSKTYVYYSLPAAEKNGLKGISKLPYSMKVLLENLLRNEDDRTVKKADIVAVSKWLKKRKLEHEVAFRPARALMQDFIGNAGIIDKAGGGERDLVRPLCLDQPLAGERVPDIVIFQAGGIAGAPVGPVPRSARETLDLCRGAAHRLRVGPPEFAVVHARRSLL